MFICVNYRYMNKENEYNKTWYWKITKPSAPCPDNWIVGTPIRLFGRVIFIKWKLAKQNYKWNNQ